MKQLLAAAGKEGAPAPHRRVAEATVGLVFYACPHMGSWLANVGWNLRYLGASPAAPVVHLKPGPHLQVALSCSFALHHLGLDGLTLTVLDSTRCAPRVKHRTSPV